jgi:hypothetical protein
MRRPTRKSAESLPASNRRPRRRALRAGAVAGATVALVLATAVTAAAGTIGTFSFSGQIAGTLKVPQVGNKKVDGVAVAFKGCQVGQESTAALINFFNVKLSLNGAKTAETAVVANIQVTKTGVAESLVPNTADDNNGFTFSVVVGTKTYTWAADSGTLTTKPGDDGGSVNAELVPAGSNTGNPLEAGAATKPVHVSGSWSSCTPWPKDA